MPNVNDYWPDTRVRAAALCSLAATEDGLTTDGAAELLDEWCPVVRGLASEAWLEVDRLNWVETPDRESMRSRYLQTEAYLLSGVLLPP